MKIFLSVEAVFLPITVRFSAPGSKSVQVIIKCSGSLTFCMDFVLNCVDCKLLIVSRSGPKFKTIFLANFLAHTQLSDHKTTETLL